jgi:S-adenosylmethionine:tRNA ribosyltransferase-isomerase
MLLSEFDFPFDPVLVADHPVIPRDRARLLVLDRQGGERVHRQVADLPSLLQSGDLVVVNNTKVMPARVPAQVRSNGRLLDLLFVEDLGQGLWEVLIKGRFRPGAVIEFPGGGTGEIVERSRLRTTVQVSGVDERLRTHAGHGHDAASSVYQAGAVSGRSGMVPDHVCPT